MYEGEEEQDELVSCHVLSCLVALTLLDSVPPPVPFPRTVPRLSPLCSGGSVFLITGLYRKYICMLSNALQIQPKGREIFCQ